MITVGVFVCGVLLFGFILYKQVYPTITPHTAPLLGVERDLKLVGDHRELTVRGTVLGFVRTNPNPPQGTLSDSFQLDSDRPDNALFEITGSLLTLRAFEGKHVEAILRFPLESEEGEYEALSMHVVDGQ